MLGAGHSLDLLCLNVYKETLFIEKSSVGVHAFTGHMGEIIIWPLLETKSMTCTMHSSFQ